MARKKRNVQAYDISVEDFSLSSLQGLHVASRGISVVVFNEVLYYVKHKEVMKKFQTLLNPTGIIIISNWFAPGGKRTFIDEMLQTIFSDAALFYNQKDHIIVSGSREDSKEEVAVKIGIFTPKVTENSSSSSSQTFKPPALPETSLTTKKAPQVSDTTLSRPSLTQQSKWLPSLNELEDNAASSFDSAFNKLGGFPVLKPAPTEKKDLVSNRNDELNSNTLLRHRGQHNKHNQHLRNNALGGGSDGPNEFGQHHKQLGGPRKKQGRKFDLTGETVQLARKSASKTAELVQNINTD